MSALKKFRTERNGYYSEQSRNDCYRAVLNDPEQYLAKSVSKVFKALRAHRSGLTLHEISANINMPVHLVSARMKDLRRLELAYDTKLERINPVSGLPNTVFKVLPGEEFNQLSLL